MNPNSTLIFSFLFSFPRDPCSVVAFSDHIYNDRGFADALHNGLGEEGVLVIQTGETDSQEEPPTEYLSDSSDARFTRHLLDAGFVSMLNFEDSHGGFLGVWSFLVVFKDLKTKGRWYANQAEVDRRIQGRVLETVEEPLFRHFDGATMMTYQYPSRSTENDFCHETKPPLMCDMGHGFDPFAPNAPVSAFHLNKSDATLLSDPTRLYVNKDVAKGSYVAIEDSVNKLILDPRTSYLVEANKKSSEVLRFKKFVEKHGFASCYYGDRAYVVDTGDLYFTNDQCMGVFEVENGITAAEYVLEDPPDPLLLHLAFNPLFERNHITYMTSAPDVRKFFQDVKAGEDVSDIVCSHVERSWNGMQARRPKVEDMKHKF